MDRIDEAQAIIGPSVDGEWIIEPTVHATALAPRAEKVISRLRDDGKIAVLSAFVAAVHDELSPEHRPWPDQAARRAGPLLELERHL